MDLAARLYDAGPSDEELAAIGILREDVEDHSVVEIWPDNDLPFRIFSDVRSQWRIGMNGPTALDHMVVFRYMDLLGIKPKKQLAVMKDIKVLESAALTQMNKR
jgi:carbohydrate-binding DOMON domain-containing protein